MVEYHLTEVANGDAERQSRRTFTDEEKRAIAPKFQHGQANS
jgi:hypothetical protein